MWFIITFTLINVLIIFFMPKKLAKFEVYVTWFLLAAIGIYTDLIFGNIIDLYDFHNPKVEWIDLVTDSIFCPSLGIIYLNFLPHDKINRIKYVLFWTAFSDGIEWVTVFIHYEKLKGWTPWYSIFIYLLVFVYLIWHIEFIRRSKAKT